MSNSIDGDTMFEALTQEVRAWCRDSGIDLDRVEWVNEHKIEWKFQSIFGLETIVTLTKDTTSWSGLKIVSEVGFVRKCLEREIRDWIKVRNNKREIGTRLGINENGKIRLNYVCDEQKVNCEALAGLLDALIAESHKMARVINDEFYAGPLHW